MKLKPYRVPENTKRNGLNPGIISLRPRCRIHQPSQTKTFYSILVCLSYDSRIECCKCSMYFNIVADSVLLLPTCALYRHIRDVVQVMLTALLMFACLYTERVDGIRLNDVLWMDGPIVDVRTIEYFLTRRKSCYNFNVVVLLFLHISNIIKRRGRTA